MKKTNKLRKLNPSHRILRARFIRALAEYLAGDQAMQSIRIEMDKPEAILWQKVRGATPLMGYPSVDEAEKTLTAWFDAGMSY